MRSNEIRLSDSEKQLLQQYRDSEFHPTVPYGYVVAEVLKEVMADA
jgi:hypothetical protein